MPNYSYSTVEQILDQAISESLGSTTSSLTALQTTALIREIDILNKNFINTFGNRSTIGYAPWMYDDDGYIFNSIDETTLNGALTTASTSIVLTSGTGFDSGAGRIWIKTTKGSVEFVDYSSRSSNTLTLSSAILDIPHATGEKVGKMYALPSNFGKVQKLKVNTIDYTYVDFKKMVTLGDLPWVLSYSISGNYILLPEGIGAQDCTLRYIKKPATLSTGSNTDDLALSIDIPKDFERWIVYMLMSYIQRTRRQREDSVQSMQLADLEFEKCVGSVTNSNLAGSIHTDY